VARTLLSASLRQFRLNGGLLGSALALGQELKPATKSVRSARFSIPRRKSSLSSKPVPRVTFVQHLAPFYTSAAKLPPNW
jgi:hypothetical protein